MNNFIFNLISTQNKSAILYEKCCTILQLKSKQRACFLSKILPSSPKRRSVCSLLTSWHFFSLVYSSLKKSAMVWLFCFVFLGEGETKVAAVVDRPAAVDGATAVDRASDLEANSEVLWGVDSSAVRATGEAFALFWVHKTRERLQ